MGRSERWFGRATAAELLGALVLAAVGGLGALHDESGSSDPLRCLLWLAVWAPAAGALAGGLGFRPWPLGLCIPGAWMILVSLVDATSERDLPAPLWAGMAWTGLFGLGFGIGAARPVAPLRRASLVLLGALLLVVAPTGAGLLTEPWPVSIAARLIDTSPATWLAECAGVDWMRHPALYEPAGTARMDPSVRNAFRGSLAAPVLLLVGFVAALVGARFAAPRPGA